VFSPCQPDGCDAGFQLNGGECLTSEQEAAASSSATDGSVWQPALIGGIVGGVALLLIAAAVAVVFFVRRRRQHSAPVESHAMDTLPKSNSTAHLLSSTSSVPPSPAPSFYNPKPIPPGPFAPQPSFRGPVAQPSFRGPVAQPSFRGPAPGAPTQFTVGMQCQARFTADDRFYNATIEDFQNGHYLVHYVDFGDSREWLAPSSLK